MAPQRDTLEIIHPGALELGVGPDEAARLDQVAGNAKTGGKAQHGAGVLRNVGLIEREAHGVSIGGSGGLRPRCRRTAKAWQD